MEKIKSITQNLVTKICHDLINPIGTAAMILESEELNANDIDSLKLCVKSGIEKIEIMRTLFNFTNFKNEDLMAKKIKNYINENNLNFKIENNNFSEFAILFFFICQKMTKFSQSTFQIYDNPSNLEYILSLENVNLIHEELQALLSDTEEITHSNIFAHLAALQYQNIFKINIEQIKEKFWKITFTKK